MTTETSTIETQESICTSPNETFRIGEKIGASLIGGEMIFLAGGLGAGKTLFTKGILSALEFDIDDVTSPSFTLVNLYKTEKFEVYHIDLWRIEGSVDARYAVGLDEILENEAAIVIIEWADRLEMSMFDRKTVRVEIVGDGDDSRRVTIS